MARGDKVIPSLRLGEPHLQKSSTHVLGSTSTQLKAASLPIAWAAHRPAKPPPTTSTVFLPILQGLARVATQAVIYV